MDQSRPNHQLLQLCTARTAWSESDQAVRAVHSCISWLFHYNALNYHCRSSGIQTTENVGFVETGTMGNVKTRWVENMQMV